MKIFQKILFPFSGPKTKFLEDKWWHRLAKVVLMVVVLVVGFFVALDFVGEMSYVSSPEQRIHFRIYEDIDAKNYVTKDQAKILFSNSTKEQGISSIQYMIDKGVVFEGSIDVDIQRKSMILVIYDLFADIRNVVAEGRTVDMNRLRELYPELSYLEDQVLDDLVIDLQNLILQGRDIDLIRLIELYPELFYENLILQQPSQIKILTVAQITSLTEGLDDDTALILIQGLLDLGYHIIEDDVFIPTFFHKTFFFLGYIWDLFLLIVIRLFWLYIVCVIFQLIYFKGILYVAYGNTNK